MPALKIAGAVFLAGAGAVIGLAERGRVYKRAESLRGLHGALLRMHSEISYARPEPREIFQRLSREPGRVGRFFKSVSNNLAGSKRDLRDAFSLALLEHSSSLCLREGEAMELIELAADIGTMDIEGALSSIARAGETFRAKSADAEAAKKNEGRLRLAVWISAAALFVLLMI